MCFGIIYTVRIFSDLAIDMPDEEPAAAAPPQNAGGGDPGDGGGVHPPPQQDVPPPPQQPLGALGAQPPAQQVGPVIQQQLGPQVSQQDVASAYRLFQSLNLTGQAPNPFPHAAAVQVPLFSVNPVHGVLGVRGAATAPASTATQLPVVDLGQGSLDKTKLAGVLTQLTREQVLLSKARREAEITATVNGFSNPMSKRAVEFTLRLDDSLDDVAAALSVGDVPLQASPDNLLQVNAAIQLVLQAVGDMKARTEATRTKHMVAKISRFGWSFVSSIEDCEGKVGHIDVSTLRAQEKAYLAHKRDVGDGANDSDDSPKKGRWHNKNQSKKQKKAAEDLRGTSGGGVTGSKGKGKGKGKKKGPPKKGCFRCGGPHYVGECTAPLSTPS